MFSMLKRNKPQAGVPFCFLRELKKCKCPKKSSEGLHEYDAATKGESTKLTPDLSEYVIVESKKSQASQVTPTIPNGSRLARSSSFRFEDDELWIVSVEDGASHKKDGVLKELRDTGVTGMVHSDTS